mmetsp:Transcript_45551/g.73244  ORF Transcript_45551/g.73244 Transcript_45551/m.73244 type:complete len:269 (+) Transcript_45551:209-1015(+)
MGYTGGTYYTGPRLSSLSEPVYMSSVGCNGRESSLQQCVFSSSVGTYCSSGTAAAVKCYPDYNYKLCKSSCSFDTELQCQNQKCTGLTKPTCTIYCTCSCADESGKIAGVVLGTIFGVGLLFVCAYYSCTAMKAQRQEARELNRLQNDNKAGGQYQRFGEQKTSNKSQFRNLFARNASDIPTAQPVRSNNAFNIPIAAPVSSNTVPVAFPVQNGGYSATPIIHPEPVHQPSAPAYAGSPPPAYEEQHVHLDGPIAEAFNVYNDNENPD